MSRRLNIAFFHPDLGIGGAERLVVDAALHLQTAGHRVTIFTAHHDQAHCFEPTRDGTLTVRVYGDFLPSQVRRRFRAPCAIARMLYLACAVRLRGERFDVIVCDLVSHAIPLLRFLSLTRIVFYCHFPDQLLTPPRYGLYRWYRAPIDWLEELTTGLADRVLVNSRFTASVFHRVFPRLHTLTPEVVYPGVDCVPYAGVPEIRADNPPTLLSINRFERKKNLELAIDAVALLRACLPAQIFTNVQLIIAGGYDENRQENRDTLLLLQTQVQQLGLTERVVFQCSPSDTERLALLSRCLCVVYTPENEHFGLVPLEAMAAGRAVVAVNSGGPLETIVHEKTGLLCDPTPKAFAEACARLILNRDEAVRLGRAGRAHVIQHFSQAAFGGRLEAVLREVAMQDRDGSDVGRE
jgi:alpha-1,3/alpha-1,6-mannosyltransferase